MENDLAELQAPAAKLAHLAELQTKYELEKPVTSILGKIVTSGYAALSLQYYFTGGPDEVRAWTIRKNTKAPQAAGVIHTDFEKNFIVIFC